LASALYWVGREFESLRGRSRPSMACAALVHPARRAAKIDWPLYGAILFLGPGNSNSVACRATVRQICRSKFGPRGGPQGEGHGWPESISPGAPFSLGCIPVTWFTPVISTGRCNTLTKTQKMACMLMNQRRRRGLYGGPANVASAPPLRSSSNNYVAIGT